MGTTTDKSASIEIARVSNGVMLTPSGRGMHPDHPYYMQRDVIVFTSLDAALEWLGGRWRENDPAKTQGP